MRDAQANNLLNAFDFTPKGDSLLQAKRSNNTIDSLKLGKVSR